MIIVLLKRRRFIFTNIIQKQIQTNHYIVFFLFLFCPTIFSVNNFLLGPTYSRFLPLNADSITPQEECNTCSSVVKNMNRWNWQKHYSSLCVGVPRHLLDLCKHYACKMAISCPEFISNKCVVDGYERFPCPTKYLCWNCLAMPSTQIAGCFDGH